MDKIKFIDLATATQQIMDHIAECEWKQRMTDCVIEFVTTQWPKRPDVRTKRKLTELLVGKGFPVWYATLEPGAAVGMATTINIKMDDRKTTMYFSVNRGSDGTLDMDRLLTQHRMYTSTVEQLKKHLPDLPDKVAQFNHHLAALIDLTDIATDRVHHPHVLYPLSQIFFTYELKQY